MKRLGKFKMILILGSLAGALAFLGNACSEFKSSADLPSAVKIDSANLPLGPDELAEVEMNNLPGAYTLGIVYDKQVLENMKSSALLPVVSNNTNTAFAERRGSFSQYGYIGDVTSAMMMGMVAVGIETCNDLANREKGTGSDKTGVFSEVNFSGTSIPVADMDNVSRKLFLMFLGRQPTLQELDILKEEIGGMSGISNQLRVVSLCASVVASLDGIRQ